MLLTTSNGGHGLFMFFCCFSLIFQSTCLKSSDFLASSLVLPVQQRGAAEVTLQKGAFQFRLLCRGSRKLWTRRWEQGQDFSQVLASPAGLAGSGLSGLSLPGCPGLVASAEPSWTLSRAAQLSQPWHTVAFPAPLRAPCAQSLLCSHRCSCCHPASQAVPPVCVLSPKCHGSLCAASQESSFYLLAPQDAPGIHSRITPAAGSPRSALQRLREP